MATISAADVKALRDRTDLPMMDCKKALTEAGGDMEKAILLLRERFKNVANKRAGNETAEGRIGTYVDPQGQVGAIVEVRCESPSVVKNEHFIALATDLAKQVALGNPKDVDALNSGPLAWQPSMTGQDRINETIGLIRENMRVNRFERLEGFCGEYVHHDGSVGVLLAVKGKSPDAALLRDVATHIAAMNPVYCRREDVPPEVVTRETELAKTQAQREGEGKPENVIEKMAEGILKRWFSESVLLEQAIANQTKYPKKTVGDVLKSAGLELVKYIRYRVGEAA
jgi:elongation factor Ts